MLPDHGRELVPPHQSREPVGAEHERVAPAQRLMGEVDLHARIGPERLEDDVAALALLRLFLGELARVHQPLHERLILGELDRLAVPDQVGAAVADLGEVQIVPVDARGGDRGAHAADLGVFPRVTVDLLIGELDRLAHAEGEALRGVVVVVDPHGGEVAVDQVGGHGAGELARRGAAHAVGHHEERAARSHLVRAGPRDAGSRSRC